MAGLVDDVSAMVLVGPPLFCSPRGSRSISLACVTTILLPTPLVNQVLSSAML